MNPSHNRKCEKVIFPLEKFKILGNLINLIIGSLAGPGQGCALENLKTLILNFSKFPKFFLIVRDSSYH